MVALCIIIVLLVLLLILPVGVDAAYAGGSPSVRVKAGPIRITLLPSKPKTARPKTPKKPKKPKNEGETEGRPKQKQKLTGNDVLKLARMALEALGRFRRHLSIDLFSLHLTVAGRDPCSAALLYGRIGSALAILSAPAHRAFKLRREDVRTAVDFERESMEVEARIAATIQIWEILYIASCALLAFLRWRREKKLAVKAANEQPADLPPAEQKG